MIRARLAERRCLDDGRLGTVRAIDVLAVLPQEHGDAAPFEQPALFLHLVKVEHGPVGDIADAPEREMDGNRRRFRPELHGPAFPARTQIIDTRKNQPAERREHEHRQKRQHECHRNEPLAERHIPKPPKMHPHLSSPHFPPSYRERITIG